MLNKLQGTYMLCIFCSLFRHEFNFNFSFRLYHQLHRLHFILLKLYLLYNLPVNTLKLLV